LIAASRIGAIGLEGNGVRSQPHNGHRCRVRNLNVGTRLAARVARELLYLLSAARVTEDAVVSGA
jgi:hypothetical protein